MKILLVILIITVITAPAIAQTRNEFHQKYNFSAAKTYLVRPNLIMIVEFANGLLWKDYACEAIIKPQKPAALSLNKSETVSSKLMIEVVDEIVPAEQRGKLIGQLSVNGGCTGMQISDYENVTINQTTRCEAQGGGTYQAPIK